MDDGMTPYQSHWSPSPGFNDTGMHMHRKMMMHMTFFWGKHTEILFFGWPGSNSGMYALSLIFIFVPAVLVEFLSHCKLIKPEANKVVAGLFHTALHAVRVGLAYMVMLAVMSFNGGVFLATVASHAIGFAVFGSQIFGEIGSWETVGSSSDEMLIRLGQNN